MPTKHSQFTLAAALAAPDYLIGLQGGGNVRYAPAAVATFLLDQDGTTRTAGSRSLKLATTDYVDRDRWRALSRGGAAVAHTGTLVETDLLLVTVPAGAMGPNGQVRISALTAAGANNANAKTVRFRFGGTAIQSLSLANTLSNECVRRIANRNAAGAQVVWPAADGSTGSVATAATTLAIDTTAAVDIRITAELGDVGDTIRLESWLIELIHGA